jgi:hypothetical protein
MGGTPREQAAWEVMSARRRGSEAVNFLSTV